ncbi:MAG: hypothetical protein MR682_01425 [Subdoligranulum variabile]|nr:hypothetical protein [Subdoligranulum variabile]
MSETNLTPAGQTAPAEFDYSVLDTDTAEKLRGITECVCELQQSYAWGMAYQVGRAHDLLCGGGSCNTVLQLHKANGNRGDATFTSWCDFVGITRQTAYRLLDAYRLICDASPEQQKNLQLAPAKLLYAAGKKDAPADLVQAVKDGDITTHKQYQELLKENQQLRADRVNALNAAQAAEHARDAALADVNGLHEQNRQLAADCNRLGLQADKANARAKEAEQRYQTAKTYAEEMERQADLAETEKAELTTRLREMENRPRDVAVMQPSEADKEKYRKEGETRMMDAAQKLADSANAARDEALQTLADLQDALPDADSCQRLADAAADALDGFSVALRSSLKAANLDAGLFCSVTRRVCASARKLLGYLEACTPAGADEDEEDDIFQ